MKKLFIVALIITYLSLSGSILTVQESNASKMVLFAVLNAAVAWFSGLVSFELEDK